MIYVFVILLVLMFVSSGCEKTVGREMFFKTVDDESENLALMPREGDRANVEVEEGITIQAEGDVVSLVFKDKAGNQYDGYIFYVPDLRGSEIKLGRDWDEPLIIKEGETINVNDYFDYEVDLGDISPHFLYYFDGYSYDVELDRIDEEDNTVRFKIRNTGEFIDETYRDDGRPTGYDFLGTTFWLVFNEEEGEITFRNINDQAGGISRIETSNGAILRLDDEKDRIIFREENEDEIGIQLTYYYIDRDIKINELIINNDAEIEIHNTQNNRYGLMEFEGRTGYGTNIYWIKLDWLGEAYIYRHLINFTYGG